MAKSDKRRLREVWYTRRRVFLRTSTIHVVCWGSEKNLQRRRSDFLRRHHILFNWRGV